MNGPPPKPAGTRRRRNATPGFKLLPHEGRTGPAPPWPLEGEPTRQELAKWSDLWTLPQSVEWERIRCYDTVALYVRVFAEASLPGVDTKLIAEVRQLDSVIGLSPKAMMSLRWETDEPLEDDEPDALVPPAGAGDRHFTPTES